MKNKSLRSIEHRPIVVTKATIDKLLKSDSPLELIGLYMFYYYTAVWQKTNTPKCTTLYTSKAMKVSDRTIQKFKRQLKDMDLISDHSPKDDKSGQITGHYIQVRFYEGTHPEEIPPGGEPQPVANLRGNAYRDNKVNAYREGKRNALCHRQSGGRRGEGLHPNIKTPFSRKMAERMHRFLTSKKLLKRKVHMPSWQAAFTRLRTEGSETKQNIRDVFDWWKENIIRNKYCPVVYSATGFCNEFARIEQAMERDMDEKSGENKGKRKSWTDDDGTVYVDMDDE